MESKSKNYIVFGVLALMVSIVAISLAYAGFSRTLNINGSGTVKNISWDVHFSSLTTSTTGTARITTAPTIKNNATTIGDYVVAFYTPGDSVTLNFDVVNLGDFNARLTGLTKGNPSCSGGTNASTVCNNLEYKLYDSSTNTEIAANDGVTLTYKTGVRHLKLVLTFKASNNANVLAASDVSVSGLGVTLTYSQYGNAVVSQ